MIGKILDKVLHEDEDDVRRVDEKKDEYILNSCSVKFLTKFFMRMKTQRTSTLITIKTRFLKRMGLFGRNTAT